jgi:serine/threonine protein kinase
MNYSIQLSKPIGKGANGIVYKAHWNNHPSLLVAVKRIPLCQRSLNEINILKSLQNNASVIGTIPQLYYVEKTNNYYDIVMEYIQGGSMMNIINKGPYPTKIVFKIMKDIFTTLELCHSRYILYGDMKPSNLLLTTSINNINLEKTLIKTIDFGLSRKHPPSYFSSRFGTITFMAPEVFDYQFSYPADIWAAGICIYILITSQYPFELPKMGVGIDDMQTIIKNQIINFNHPNWIIYGDEVRLMVKQMLNINPLKRPTAIEVIDFLNRI